MDEKTNVDSSSNQRQLLEDASEKVERVLKQILAKFPTAEEEFLRLEVDTLSNKCFDIIKVDKGYQAYLPQNLEALADVPLVIAWCHWADTLGAKFITTKRVITSSMKAEKSSEGQWLLGYASVGKKSDKWNQSTSAWSKGRKTKLLECIRANINPEALTALRISNNKVGDILAKCSFKQEDYRIRANFVRSLSITIEVPFTNEDLGTFFQSLEELMNGTIKKSFNWNNGGLFLSEEIEYIDRIATPDIDRYEAFKARIRSRDFKTLKTFDTQYNDALKGVKELESMLQPLIADRAMIFFGNKKRTKRSKLSLLDKIEDLDEDQFRKLFRPSRLPQWKLRISIDDIISSKGKISVSEASNDDDYEKDFAGVQAGNVVRRLAELAKVFNPEKKS